VSLALLNDMFEAVDSNNWSDLRRCYSEDCVYARPGFARIEGLEALIHFYQHVRLIHSGRHTLRHVVTEIPCVSASGEFKGTLRNGNPIQLEFMDLYVVSAGRIQNRQTYFFTPLA
jgi:ketosteroid isomerase-like protein